MIETLKLESQIVPSIISAIYRTEPALDECASPRKSTRAPTNLASVSITILRLPDVIKRTGLCRASIYAYVSRKEFPKQVSLGSRAVGWIEHEVNDWLVQRVSSGRT